MEGSKVITEVNSDLLTNKQLKIQSKITATGKLDTEFSTSNYFGIKPAHLFHSEGRRFFYSPGKSYDVESQVRPESLYEAHKKTEAYNNKEVIYEHVNVTEKSVTFYERDNLDAKVTMKVKHTKNKNQTLRLSKRTCTNSSRNSTVEQSEGQSSIEKDVFKNKEQQLLSCDGERDEYKDHLQNKLKGFRDFIVHSSEEDYNTALNFQEDLLKLGIPNLTVENFVHINSEKTEMESISSLHEQCNTVLLFVTHNYTKDKLRRRQAEMLLMADLETEGLQHRVVPIWAEKDVNKSIRELAPIKGIQFYQLQQKRAYFSKQVIDLVRTGRERSEY